MYPWLIRRIDSGSSNTPPHLRRLPMEVDGVWWVPLGVLSYHFDLLEDAYEDVQIFDIPQGDVDGEAFLL